MEEKTLVELVSNHSIIGAGIAASLALLYKVWRILRADRKVDDLDSAERAYREELRADVKGLREEIKALREENGKLRNRLQWLEVCFQSCKDNHPPECPLMKHFGDLAPHNTIDPIGNHAQ